MGKKLFLLMCFLLVTCQFALALETTQLTFEKQGLVNPALAPGNKMIAYCQSQSGKNIIYIKPFSPDKGTSQGNARKTYETFNKIINPLWSPVGNQLAFIESSKDNTPGILTLLGLDGKVQKLVDAVELFAFNYQGTQLVYKKGRDLQILDLKTSTSKKIFTGDSSPITSLDWRRDGAITFVKKRFFGYPQVWSVDTSGKQSLLFSLNGHGTITNHTWSNNNERLVYKDASSSLATLWSADRNGNNRLMLASGAVELAGWYGNDAFFFAQKDSSGLFQIWLAKLVDKPAPPKPEPPKPEPPKPEPPRPLPIPGEEQVYYFNGFDREQSWGSYQGTRDRVKKGTYEIKVSQRNQSLKYLAPTTIPTADFTLEVELKNQKKDGKAGLVFNLVDWDNFYVFVVDPQNRTYSLMRQEYNRSVTVIRETRVYALQQKGINKLKVRQSGRQLTLYLNDQQLNRVNLNRTWKDTKAGIWVASEQKTPVEFSFDNFRIMIPKYYQQPVPKVLFSDNFSNSRSGWPTGNFQDTTAEYRSGEYRIKINNSYSGYGYFAPVRVPTNSYEVEVDLRFQRRATGEAGLIFNSTGGDNFYLFKVNPTARSWSVFIYSYGRKETIAEGSRVDFNSQTNRLKILQQHNNLEVYLNGRLLARRSSSAPSACQVGLMVSSQDRVPTEVYFDNFIVTVAGSQNFDSQPRIQFMNPKLDLPPIFKLSGSNPEPKNNVMAMATLALLVTPAATQLAGPWYPAVEEPKSSATAGFSVHLPLGGTLPLTTTGGGKLIYATFHDDDGDEYAFSKEQNDWAEAKANFPPLTLSFPLSGGQFFKVSLAFSVRGFDNPILVPFTVEQEAGGYLLNLASSINLSLPLGDYLELFGGVGLGKYLLNTQNALEGSDPWDEGYRDGEKVYAPGTAINLSGWSNSGGTFNCGVRFKITPNLSLEGQYSNLPGGTISSFKYSLGGVLFSKAVHATDQPNPISIQGQSLLSLGACLSF